MLRSPTIGHRVYVASQIPYSHTLQCCLKWLRTKLCVNEDQAVASLLQSPPISPVNVKTRMDLGSMPWWATMHHTLRTTVVVLPDPAPAGSHMCTLNCNPFEATHFRLLLIAHTTKIYRRGNASRCVPRPDPSHVPATCPYQCLHTQCLHNVYPMEHQRGIHKVIAS